MALLRGSKAAVDNGKLDEEATGSPLVLSKATAAVVDEAFF